jgi:hypothetical protein
MTKLLQRDTFFAPEIDDVDGLVIRSVRLSFVVDIESNVWPSKLVENEDLLGAIAETVGIRAKTSICRAKKCMKINHNWRRLFCKYF